MNTVYVCESNRMLPSWARYYMQGRQFKDGIEKNTDIMESSKDFLNSLWYKISYNPVISCWIIYAKETNINLYTNVDSQPSYSVPSTWNWIATPKTSLMKILELFLFVSIRELCPEWLVESIYWHWIKSFTFNSALHHQFLYSYQGCWEKTHPFFPLKLLTYLNFNSYVCFKGKI